MDEYFTNEDEFILGEDQPNQNGSAEQELPANILEMPRSSKRKIKKTKSKKNKKSKKRKTTKKKKTKRSNKKMKSKSDKKVYNATADEKRKIPIRLDEKMRSMALLEFEDDQIDIKRSENESKVMKKQSSSTSTTLIDEILSNQAKIFVPSKLLKINRDGTLEETERFNKYLARKCQSKTVEHPSTIDTNEQLESGKYDSKMISQNRPSKEMPPMNPADSNNNKTIQWPNIESTATSDLQSIQLPITNRMLIPQPHNRLDPLPTSLPPQSTAFLMPQNQNMNNVLFGGMSNLLKGQNQLLNSQFSLPMLNNAQQQIVSTSTNSLAPFLAANPHHNILPSLMNIFGAQKPLPIGLSNALLERMNQQQRASSMPSDGPTPVPPPPSVLNGNDPALLIPPPPPPYQSTSRCGVDSPMDIEDEDRHEKGGQKDTQRDKDNVSPEKKKRSRNVQIADELMKKWLKPYFIRRKITKEEYKDIMKKGVAKLSKLESLRPEKVEKFVEKYVHTIRKTKEGRRPLNRNGGH